VGVGQRALEAMVSGGAAGVDPAFWSGRRVFVTGHTGFKGGWLVFWLARMGAVVKGYALAPERAHDLFHAIALGELCESEIADVRDRARLARSIAAFRPEVLLHLAAQPLVRRGYREPVETFAINVLGTAHVLDACRGIPGLGAIVVVTTDKVYENAEAGSAFVESDPLGGAEPYGLSKAAAELAAQAWRMAFFAEAGPALATARAGNVIGGGDWSEDRLVADAMRAFTSGGTLVLRNPDAVRPWQHVLEPLAGYLMLSERLARGDRTCARGWNFGPAPGQSVSVADVVGRITDRWGVGARWRVERRPDAPHEAAFLALDSSLAAERLGWRPRLDLDRAVEMTVDWYRLWAKGGDTGALRRLMGEQIAAVPSVSV
jgi:CDP-glucose 4,6-dehydratase